MINLGGFTYCLNKILLLRQMHLSCMKVDSLGCLFVLSVAVGTSDISPSPTSSSRRVPESRSEVSGPPTDLFDSSYG